MDLGKLIDLLHQYPLWYRFLLYLWLLGSAVLAGGLIFLRQESPPAQPPEAVIVLSEAPPSTTPVLEPMQIDSSLTSSAQPAGALTGHAYFTTLRSLSERFLERQEFVERMTGVTVEWEGLVDSVSQRKYSINVDFAVSGVEPTKIVTAYLPEALRTKAFSLQKGDVVRVKGTLTTSIPNMPDIEATELTLLRPKGAL